MAVTDHSTKSTKSKPKPNNAEPDTPWKVEPNGQKKRTGRALPGEAKLREFFITTSGIAKLAGDDFVANAILVKHEEIAYGWAKLAREEPRVKAVLDMLTAGGAWGEAVIPTASLVLVIAWHRGLVPDQVGVPMTMANGLAPESREVELQRKQKEHEDANAGSDE